MAGSVRVIERLQDSNVIFNRQRKISPTKNSKQSYSAIA